MMVRCDMNHFKGFPRLYEVSDEFWENLKFFVEDDELAHQGQYEYNKNIFYLYRSRRFDEWLREHCSGVDELRLFDEIRKEMFGNNILLEHVFIVNSFEKHAVRIKDGYAYFHKKTGDGCFKVKLSDKVKDKISKGDLCKVNVLGTGDWLVVDCYDETSSSCCRNDLIDLLGGY